MDAVDGRSDIVADAAQELGFCNVGAACFLRFFHNLRLIVRLARLFFVDVLQYSQNVERLSAIVKIDDRNRYAAPGDRIAAHGLIVEIEAFAHVRQLFAAERIADILGRHLFINLCLIAVQNRVSDKCLFQLRVYAAFGDSRLQPRRKKYAFIAVFYQIYVENRKIDIFQRVEHIDCPLKMEIRLTQGALAVRECVVPIRNQNQQERDIEHRKRQRDGKRCGERRKQREVDVERVIAAG